MNLAVIGPVIKSRGSRLANPDKIATVVEDEEAAAVGGHTLADNE